jgi:dienelactone hydrolase
VTAPEADLSGWLVEPFTGGGYTHDVYRKGTGPGVVLIPEIPGIHPGVLGLGNHLVDNGFTVAMPSLFGEPGKPKTVGYTAASRGPVWQRSSRHSQPTSSGRCPYSCVRWPVI